MPWPLLQVSFDAYYDKVAQKSLTITIPGAADVFLSAGVTQSHDLSELFNLVYYMATRGYDRAIQARKRYLPVPLRAALPTPPSPIHPFRPLIHVPIARAVAIPTRRRRTLLKSVLPSSPPQTRGGSGCRKQNTLASTQTRGRKAEKLTGNQLAGRIYT